MEIDIQSPVWDMFSKFTAPAAASAAPEDIPKCAFPGCPNPNVRLEEGDYICSTCHTMQQRFIDSTAEWRFYGNDDNKATDPTRCGMPTNEYLPIMSLGSVLTLERGMSNTMFRIYKYHKWNSMTYKERTLMNKFDTLTLKSLNGGLPQCIIDEAKAFYKRFTDLKLSRGENTDSMLATSIYMSCKKNQVPRSAKEIAKMFNLNITSMTKGCKRFEDMLKLNMNSSTTAVDFVHRFCSRLGFSDSMTELCAHVVKKEQEYSFTSESAPQSITAGCIFLVNMIMNIGLTRKDVATACDVSEMTINKCFKRLFEFKEALFPEGMIPSEEELEEASEAKAKGKGKGKSKKVVPPKPITAEFYSLSRPKEEPKKNAIKKKAPLKKPTAAVNVSEVSSPKKKKARMTKPEPVQEAIPNTPPSRKKAAASVIVSVQDPVQETAKTPRSGKKAVVSVTPVDETAAVSVQDPVQETIPKTPRSRKKAVVSVTPVDETAAVSVQETIPKTPRSRKKAVVSVTPVDETAAVSVQETIPKTPCSRKKAVSEQNKENIQPSEPAVVTVSLADIMKPAAAMTMAPPAPKKRTRAKPAATPASENNIMMYMI